MNHQYKRSPLIRKPAQNKKTGSGKQLEICLASLTFAVTVFFIGETIADEVVKPILHIFCFLLVGVGVVFGGLAFKYHLNNVGNMPSKRQLKKNFTNSSKAWHGIETTDYVSLKSHRKSSYSVRGRGERPSSLFGSTFAEEEQAYQARKRAGNE